MRVDGNRRQPVDRGDVAQMRPEALLIDRKIVEERQQDGRNDAVRRILGVAGHVAALLYGRVFHTTYITPAPAFGMTRR